MQSVDVSGHSLPVPLVTGAAGAALGLAGARVQGVRGLRTIGRLAAFAGGVAVIGSAGAAWFSVGRQGAADTARGADLTSTTTSTTTPPHVPEPTTTTTTSPSSTTTTSTTTSIEVTHDTIAVPTSTAGAPDDGVVERGDAQAIVDGITWEGDPEAVASLRAAMDLLLASDVGHATIAAAPQEVRTIRVLPTEAYNAEFPEFSAGVAQLGAATIVVKSEGLDDPVGLAALLAHEISHLADNVPRHIPEFGDDSSQLHSLWTEARSYLMTGVFLLEQEGTLERFPLESDNGSLPSVRDIAEEVAAEYPEHAGTTIVIPDDFEELVAQGDPDISAIIFSER